MTPNVAFAAGTLVDIREREKINESWLFCRCKFDFVAARLPIVLVAAEVNISPNVGVCSYKS